MRFPIVFALSVVFVVSVGSVFKYGHCLECPSDSPAAHYEATATALAPALTNTIVFTNSGFPVRLIEASQVKTTDIRIHDAVLFDAIGSPINQGSLVAISVYQNQPAQPLAKPEPSYDLASLDGDGMSRKTAVNDKPIIGLDRPKVTATTFRYTDAHVHNHTSEPDSSLVGEKSAAPHQAFGKAWSDTTATRTPEHHDRRAQAKPHKSTTSRRTPTLHSPPDDYWRPRSLGREARIAQLAAPSSPISSDYSARLSAPESPNQAIAGKMVAHADDGSDDSGSSSDSDDIEDSVDDISDDLDDLSDTVDDLSATVDDVKDSLSTVENQVGTLQGQVGDVDVTSLSSNFDDLSSQVTSLEKKTYAGIAATASLVTAIPSDPGKTILNVGYGYYQGQQAMGISLSRRMSTINGYYYSGLATGLSDTKIPLVRVGVGIEF